MSRFLAIVILPVFLCSGAVANGARVAGGHIKQATRGEKEIKTWKEAVAAAYGHSPELKAFQARFRAAQDAVSQATAEWIPNVQAKAGYAHSVSKTPGLDKKSHKNQANISLEMSQNLFSCGGTSARIGAANSKREGARLQLLEKESSVLLEVLQVFLEVGAASRSIKVNSENVERSKKLLAQAEKSSGLGALDRKDELLARANLADAEAKLADAQSRFRIARSEFFRLTNAQPSPNLVWPDDLGFDVVESTGGAEKNLLKDNFSVQRAMQEERASDLVVDSELSKNMLPSLDMNAGITKSFNKAPLYVGGPSQSQRPLDMQAGVTLRVPISLGGQQASVRQAQQVHAQNAWERRALQLSVKGKVLTAQSKLRVAKENLKRHMLERDANKEALNAMQLGMGLGGNTIVDVSEVQLRVLNAHQSLIEADKERIVQTLTKRALLGQLTLKALGIKVNYYNEKAYKPWIGLAGGGNLPQG